MCEKEIDFIVFGKKLIKEIHWLEQKRSLQNKKKFIVFAMPGGAQF